MHVKLFHVRVGGGDWRLGLTGISSTCSSQAHAAPRAIYLPHTKRHSTDWRTTRHIPTPWPRKHRDECLDQSAPHRVYVARGNPILSLTPTHSLMSGRESSAVPSSSYLGTILTSAAAGVPPAITTRARRTSLSTSRALPPATTAHHGPLLCEAPLLESVKPTHLIHIHEMRTGIRGLNRVWRPTEILARLAANLWQAVQGSAKVSCDSQRGVWL